jgi:hypothetical protein
VAQINREKREKCEKIFATTAMLSSCEIIIMLFQEQPQQCLTADSFDDVKKEKKEQLC